MSRTAELKNRIHSLNDIEAILGAMKSLAVIEMNKVGRVIARLERMQETISSALADFESHYSRDRKASPTATLCLLIGSERGFCGPFNERVIDALLEAHKAGRVQKVITVGRKLTLKLEGKVPVELALSGPNSAEEIPAVLGELSTKLIPFAGERWMFVHNDGGGPLTSMPLEQKILSPASRHTSAPHLNMKPELLHAQLLEQHLYSVLNTALYISFYGENRERLQHMEGALNHIEKDGSDLLRKLNGRRQEDITEELEILMMNFAEKSQRNAHDTL